MLAGRYPSDAFAELRPRIVWDRDDDVLTARPGAQQLAVTSGGTIPDRGLFGVHIVGGGRVGELDEEMVYESRVGDIFALGASSWQIVEITHDRVNVVPAAGSPGRLPVLAWGQPRAPRRAGPCHRGVHPPAVRAGRPTTARAHLAELGLDAWAGANLVAYLAEQSAASHVPTDRTIVVERTRDELGDWRLDRAVPVRCPGARSLGAAGPGAAERGASASMQRSCTATTGSSPACRTFPTTSGSPTRRPACSPSPTRSRPTSPA